MGWARCLCSFLAPGTLISGQLSQLCLGFPTPYTAEQQPSSRPSSPHWDTGVRSEPAGKAQLTMQQLTSYGRKASHPKPQASRLGKFLRPAWAECSASSQYSSALQGGRCVRTPDTAGARQLNPYTSPPGESPLHPPAKSHSHTLPSPALCNPWMSGCFCSSSKPSHKGAWRS